MNTIILIPCHMASKRFPGKPMAMARGKPLVHWTYENAMKSDADGVFVASPDVEILNYCCQSNIPYIRTRPEHYSGTHRCIETISKVTGHENCHRILNVQVDEPLVPVGDLNILLEAKGDEIYTLIARLPIAARDDTNTVKAAASSKQCVWFSRQWFFGAYQHIGVYSFSLSTLRSLAGPGRSSISLMERLEQLEWIERGKTIIPVFSTRYDDISDTSYLSINTQDDFEKFKRVL